MSSIRWLKYILTSAALILVCAVFALAADDPVVATLNGQPYTSLNAASSAAQPGDLLRLVSDTTLTENLTIAPGVRFDVPRGITLDTGTYNISSFGNTTVYGRIFRTVSSASSGNTIQVNTGTFDLYGSIVNTSYGIGIRIPSTGSAVVNIYDGTIISPSYPVSAAGGLVNVYGGSFSPSLTPDEHIVLAPGVSLFEGGTIASFGPLQFIGQFVVSACQWLALFCAVIVENKLLIIFILVVFSALGIGLIKRIVR